MFRVGIGFDVHQLVEGRKLVLGGIEIPYPKGLDGHSDADVVTHAIIDSIIGAAGLGDIGRIFPDDDPAYKDISSLILLGRIREMIYDRGYKVNNIDVIIAAENPKLLKYFDKMENSISKVLGADVSRINIKATTTEGLGFVGKGEGIAAISVSTLIQ